MFKVSVFWFHSWFWASWKRLTIQTGSSSSRSNNRQLQVSFPANLRLTWSCKIQQAWNLNCARDRLHQLGSDFSGWTVALTHPAQTEFGHIIWFRLEMNDNILGCRARMCDCNPSLPCDWNVKTPGSNLTQNKVIWGDFFFFFFLPPCPLFC